MAAQNAPPSVQFSAPLHVHIDGIAQAVGQLTRSDIHADAYLFDYAAPSLAAPPAVRPQHAVSLTMPVANAQYDAMSVVHPIFEMNLPEGALREKLTRRFAKAMPNFDSLSLLSVVGASQIGRLRYANGAPAEPVAVAQLLAYAGAEDLFAQLMERYCVDSGISGMQPKILLRDDVPLDKITHRGATHIVKSFDPREYPELAANEFFCMQAARLAGLPTAKVQLSVNRKMLVVERFDIAANSKNPSAAAYLGFEDFCVLSGLRSDGRYSGSYEDLAHKITLYLDGAERLAALRQLFATLVLACAVGNGDAHLKNFGLLYSTPGHQVRLAPVYDMVSTVAYHARDSMALTLSGSKAFASHAQLVAFGRQTCLLSASAVAQVMQAVAQGVRQALVLMKDYAGHKADFADSAQTLALIFEKGLERTLQ